MLSNVSLVKYNTPTLVSTTGGAQKGGSKKKAAAAANERKTSQTEDILNSILPPRFFCLLASCVEGVCVCQL